MLFEAIPAYICNDCYAFSSLVISEGISMGVISYTVFTSCTTEKKIRKISILNVYF